MVGSHRVCLGRASSADTGPCGRATHLCSFSGCARSVPLLLALALSAEHEADPIVRFRKKGLKIQPHTYNHGRRVQVITVSHNTVLSVVVVPSLSVPSPVLFRPVPSLP